MKILFDGRMYGTEFTGIGRYVQNLVTHLQKIDSKNQYFILLRSDKYKTLRLKDNWTKIEADFRHYSIAEQIKLPQIIKKIDFDIAHFPHFNLPLMIKKPFVVTIHDVTMHKSIGKNATTLPTAFYTLKRLGYKKVFDHAVNNSKKIISPSKYVKNDIINRFDINPERVKVIYEGLDELVRPIQSNESNYKSKFKNILDIKYFVYAGNAYPHKNLERLVESFAYLLEDSKFDPKLVIITKKNKFRANLQALIQENNLQKSVYFYENLTDDELGYVYSNALAFIYPSLEEGFGLQGLEAIANKTLLAASDIKIFKEIYGKSAIYFNPYDFSAIQSTMFDILNMKVEQRKKLLKEQKKVLENYSLDRMASETLKIYNNIL